MSFEGIEKNLKHKEPSPERLENARKVFHDFFEMKPGERVLFLTDADPESTDRELIETFKKQLESEGVEFLELIVDDKKTTTEDVEALLKSHQILWSSCNWDANEIDFYKLVDALPGMNARMANSDGVRADSLDENGALAEKRDVLEERLGRMEEKLREAVGFHIRTSYGTDLTVEFRPRGERRWFMDTGVIKPGKWDNIPGGEIFTTPDEERVNGVLVLPVLQDEIVRHQGVDEFVRLTIRGGKIAKIDGGKSAEKLRKYLEHHSKDEKDPLSVIQCAEIAFGANEKARSRVSDPEGSWKKKGIPVLEGEKRLGTMHMAFGSAKHGEEGTEGHTESNVHVDFVIPRSGLTVEKFDSMDKFRSGKGGEKLIDEGRWRFIN